MDSEKSIFNQAWNAIKFILLAPFHVVRKIFVYFLVIAFLVVAGYTSKEAYDYHRFSHSYASSPPCPDLIRGLGIAASSATGDVRCLNVSGKEEESLPDVPRHFVLFMANEDSPTPEATGHGWVIFLKASKNESGSYVVHEFLPTGFAPENRKTKWPDILIAYYARFQKYIPASIEPSVGKFLQALYLPMKLTDEGAPQIVDGNLVIDEQFTTNPEFRKLFGNKPQAILAAAVTEIEYENAKRFKNKFVKSDYRILVNDCTTFVYKVADKVNLYTPPRIFHPFPFDSVTAISEMNRSMN